MLVNSLIGSLLLKVELQIEEFKIYTNLKLYILLTH